MANFLINSPSSESVGTNTSDLFSISVINGTTVFGTDGADTVTANGDALAAGSDAKINVGKGADLVTLSGAGAVLSSSVVFGGMGKDTILTDRDLVGVNVRGGAGLDTISLSASLLSATTINGNDMADTISAGIEAGSTNSIIAAGLGKDTLSAVFVSGASDMTINGGAGHDSISLTQAVLGIQSGLIVAGGDGKDSISFDAVAASALAGNYNINGGSLGDTISFAGDVESTTTSTIGGGLGADTITFALDLNQANGFVNGGAGNDSIYISGDYLAGSMFGGAGNDSITLSDFAIGTAAALTYGTMYGGAGADEFSLGAASIAAVTGHSIVNTGAGSQIGYISFDDSNLTTFDTVSAGLTITTGDKVLGGVVTATLFKINQDVLTASAATNISVSNFSGTDGVATFTSTFTNNLTARVVELDRVLAKGQVIAFEDGSSNDYIFLQAGAAGSGTDGDLFLALNTAVDKITVSANSAISIGTNQTV